MSEYLQSLVRPDVFYTDFDVDNPVEIFHEQTKYFRATSGGQFRSVVRYLVNKEYIRIAASGFHDYSYSEPIELPPPATLDVSLSHTLRARRSITPRGGMSLLELSTLLKLALGVTARRPVEGVDDAYWHLRSYPSPGGLYPIEAYLYLNDIEGMPACLVHYDARRHLLRILKKYDHGEVRSTGLLADEKTRAAPVVLVLTMLPQRVTAKYGARGYRMGLLEAGHAGQNICLVGTGMGLATLPYGSYFDDEVAADLDIDGVTETVVSLSLIGRACP